ncbi:MAG TPA: hypothetical protein VN436_01850 [Holophaga sp.]|nr:hypothetical protein [Holophaga sp.]
MPRFALFDLLRWIHFVFVAMAGGAAATALVLSGLEEEHREYRGLASVLWRRVVAWGFRLAVATGLLLVAFQFQQGGHPFDARYLPVKLVLAALLLIVSEGSAGALAKAKRGAPLLAMLFFLLASFVGVNRQAFGRTPSAPPELSAAPAE